jgi:hypothetical protein
MKFYTPFQRIFTKFEVVNSVLFVDESFFFQINDLYNLKSLYMIQNAYVSTGGLCGYFHRDNSMLYIGHPSHGGDQTGVDGFFLHRVTPLEMVSLFMVVCCISI